MKDKKQHTISEKRTEDQSGLEMPTTKDKWGGGNQANPYRAVEAGFPPKTNQNPTKTQQNENQASGHLQANIKSKRN